jgi:hypothetical protein
MVGEWAAGAAAVFAVFTALRIYGNSIGAKWTPFVPGGIAVAVGESIHTKMLTKIPSRATD